MNKKISNLIDELGFKARYESNLEKKETYIEIMEKLIDLQVEYLVETMEEAKETLNKLGKEAN